MIFTAVDMITNKPLSGFSVSVDGVVSRDMGGIVDVDIKRDSGKIEFIKSGYSGNKFLSGSDFLDSFYPASNNYEIVFEKKTNFLPYLGIALIVLSLIKKFQPRGLR